MDLFKGRRLVVATKHQKEEVIAPILEAYLGVISIIPENFDTDALGTFSGEVERELDPISTARKKCLLAMKAAKSDLGVASEGSFGPHPTFVFKPADDEFLIFIDKLNGLEILVRELSTETNFSGKKIQNEKELWTFAAEARFPSHKLILRPSKMANQDIYKDISDKVSLLDTYIKLEEKYGTAYAETDMRAMNNPSRMEVIRKATVKLVEKINSICPECTTPGFGVTEVKRGLKCSLCGSPTSSILSHIYSCQKCSFVQEKLHPNEKALEEPMYCNYCNP
ncbi:MAG: DUF6671 family protein [Flavobacteriales bacterium]